MVREVVKEDLDALLDLYLFLHEDSIPDHDNHLEKTWTQIIEDPNHHLLVNEIDGQIVSSCVCPVTQIRDYQSLLQTAEASSMQTGTSSL